ncbi:hypothetical protein SAMN05216359_103150 [Roseateles sp. YR242]|uniref:DUF6515 family protein n=1 Tax=Roseateles sp. YR242 TaxID=1855305 RepID=UPI0008BAB3BD|nr:DUF6515 family protein [Roseateles sp. YR242]SEK80543.1 hypothetical protein SAMN05216359_103150 [Roseateles sp. YR242]
MSKLRWLIPVTLALASAMACAQDHDHDRGHGPGGPGAGPGHSAGPGPGAGPGRAGGGSRTNVNIGLNFDTRYHHDHYYPAPGYMARGLPPGATFVGGRYWYHGGVWYQPWGPSFRVIVPPIGLVIPILPSAYVTLRIGGLPYYYANGVYYSAAPEGYVVVAPPPGAEAVPQAQVATTPPPKPDPIIYPRNGQSTAQTESDRQECNRWATTQPTAMNDANVFNRAVEACMDGRGYSMR